jgi:hypothetical protein
MVYDDVIERLKAECDRFELDPVRAFPEPPGMDEVRRERGHRGPERPEDKAETPAQQPED